MIAVGAAPQLVGVLRRFPGVIWTDRLVIPGALAAELADVWVLPAREATIDTRLALGDLGELYSYRFERMRAQDPAKIHWVARDDAGLGYDIEDLNSTPHRQIEVKASGGIEPRFFLSKNEWDVAHSNAGTYEIQFWGGIDLQRRAREEFTRLRARGFPLIYRDLPTLVADGTLNAAVSQYLVTKGDSGTG
jgi:hypothetical protein